MNPLGCVWASQCLVFIYMLENTPNTDIPPQFSAVTFWKSGKIEREMKEKLDEFNVKEKNELWNQWKMLNHCLICFLFTVF